MVVVVIVVIVVIVVAWAAVEQQTVKFLRLADLHFLLARERVCDLLKKTRSLVGLNNFATI